MPYFHIPVWFCSRVDSSLDKIRISWETSENSLGHMCTLMKIITYDIFHISNPEIELFTFEDIQTQWVHNTYRINFSLLSCSSGIEFKSFSVKVLQTFSYNFGKKPSGAFFSDSCRVTPDAIIATHLWNNYYEWIVNSRYLWSILCLCHQILTPII